MNITKFIASTLALGLTALLYGCNNNSEVSTLSTTTRAEVGSVAVLVTDAPIDNFDQFWLTVTEISLLGGDGKISLFSGSERLNLLDLNSHADLFSLADNIPVGYYSKLRLRVSDPELLKLDTDGNVLERIVPEMSGNGKLDLNPRGGLQVLPGQTLALQIDLDANKSIHLIQQGNGPYRFRPVIFVDVLTDDMSGKLLRVAGVVGDIDTYTDSFELCHTGMATKRDDDDNEHDAEYDSEHARCIQVTTNTDTVFFNNEGAPLQAVVLTENEPVTVLGYFRNLSDHKIGLDAQVVELAAADLYQQTTGIVESLDLDNNTFTLRDKDDNLLTIEFDNTSKFFAMTGELLGSNDLDIGDKVKVDGVVFVADDLIKAAAIFIDATVPSVAQLSGTVSLLHHDLLGFDMSDETLGTVCVRVNDSTDYYLLTVTGDGFSSEEVSYLDLQDTQHIEAYGAFNLTGCFEAENILAEAL